MRMRAPFEPYHPQGEIMFWISAGIRLALLALLIAGVILLARYLMQRYPARANGPLPPAAGASSTALQILEERFARGEIDEDEFRRRKDALRS